MLVAAFPPAVPPYVLCVLVVELGAWLAGQVAAWTSHPGLSAVGVATL